MTARLPRSVNSSIPRSWTAEDRCLVPVPYFHIFGVLGCVAANALAGSTQILMEVFEPREKRWILYDPDMKCRFRHAGRYLNLGEAVALYRKGGSAELEFFCPPAIDTYAEEKASAESAQYSLLFEWAFRDATARQAWYRRMMQVPLLNGSAGTWREADVARIRATGYGKPVVWDEWMRAAYGKEANRIKESLWAAYEQTGSSMSFFAEDHTRRMLMGIEIPAPWFQSINPIIIITCAPFTQIAMVPHPCAV